MPSTASPWDAYLEVMNAGHPGVSYRDIQRLAVDAAVRAMKNTGEGASTHEGDVCSDRESAPAAPRNTPSPASSVPAPATGEVPAWIPSVEEMLELIDDGREGDLISLIAIRAPRPWGAFSGEQHDAAAEALCKDFGHSLTDSNRFRFGQAVNVVLRALGHPAPLPAPQPSVEQGYGSIFAACADRLAWARWSGPDGSARPCSDMEAIRAVHALLDDHDCWKALAEKRRKEIEAMKPKPQPSVEEMAERLLNAQLKHYGLSPRAWAQVGEEERAYWLALARAALAPTNTPAASGGRDGVE